MWPDRRTARSPHTSAPRPPSDRKSTRLNSSHANISYAVFCLKKKKQTSELQSRQYLVCRLLIKKRKTPHNILKQKQGPHQKRLRYSIHSLRRACETRQISFF